LVLAARIGETWGIGGPIFLVLYLVLCGLVATGSRLYWWRMLGPRPPLAGSGELTASDLAMLNGGAALAIAAAAAKLRQDRLLVPGHGQTLQAQGTIARDSDPLEREVFRAVERHPNIASQALRRGLEHSVGIAEKRTMLTASGLLLNPSVVSRLRSSSIAGAPLALLGVARLLAGGDADTVAAVLALAVCAVTTVSLYVALRCPSATKSGRVLIAGRRRQHERLKTHAVSTEIPLAVALYGTDALWRSDPAFATAWGVRFRGVEIDGGGGA
jgi:uncharacterized protein (TIGR04222 family)